MTSMPKDTKTRYQGVYARHKTDCAIENDEGCNCIPSYWGKAWDRSAGRPRKTRAFTALGVARQARADLEASLRAGILPASNSMRFDKTTEAFLRAIEAGTARNKHGRRYRASAIRDLRGALQGHASEHLGAKRIADIRRGDVQHLIDKLDEAGLSGSRVRTHVNAIRSLYAWAQDRELVDHNPASRVRLPAMDAKPRDRVATVAEMETLLAALELKDALPYAIAVYTTARRAEIRYALVDDVDLDIDVIYLAEDERARKSRDSKRAVPLVKPLSAMIRRSLMARGRPNGKELLCPGHKPGGRNSGMLSFEALQDRADEAWAAAGRDRITAHECRHTCITWLDAAGARPKVVSKLAGHSTVARQEGGAQITQERYTHTLPGDLEKARAQLEAFIANHRLEATGVSRFGPYDGP